MTNILLGRQRLEAWPGRRRVADLLAALTDYLVVIQTGRPRGAGGPPRDVAVDGTAARMRGALAETHGRVAVAFDRLAEIAPPLRAQRALARLARRLPPGRRGRTRAAHRYDAVEALLACRAPLRAVTGELAARGTPPPRSGRREIAQARERVVAGRRALAAAGVRTRR
ncbi:hypothetical protein [Frankia sp. AgKG'84/4]